MQKKSKSFRKVDGMSRPKQQQVFLTEDKNDVTIKAIEEARASGQGVVTYHFEIEDTYDDYSKYDMNNLPKNKFGKPVELIPEKKPTGSKTKWNKVQPINKEVFFDTNGRPEKAENVKLLFIQTARDIGAKYFTV